MVSAVAQQARADGFTGLRGAGGPLAWGGLPDDEQRAVGSYEAQVNEVLRKEGVAAMCLYDERSAGSGALRRMLRTHPQAILDGRLCSNPFCGGVEGHGVPDDSSEVECMLHALRRGSHGLDEVVARDPVVRAPLVAEARRLAGEVHRLREREAAKSEEVESRNALLRAITRQLVAAGGGAGQRRWARPPMHRSPRRRGANGAIPWSRCARAPPTCAAWRASWRPPASSPPGRRRPFTEAGELTALTAATMEAWRRSRNIDGTDVRLQAVGARSPAAGICGRIGSVVQTVLETAWERSWGSPVDMFVEDLGIKARLRRSTRTWRSSPARRSTPTGAGADLVAARPGQLAGGAVGGAGERARAWAGRWGCRCGRTGGCR